MQLVLPIAKNPWVRISTRLFLPRLLPIAVCSVFSWLVVSLVGVSVSLSLTQLGLIWGMLQQTTMMITQIQTTSNYKKRSSRHENECNSNESASIKSTSSSSANHHATNPKSSKANNYKSLTFENPTTNTELLTQPDQEKENSYHTLVSTGTTDLLPKKYRNPTKSTPTVKRVLAPDADQCLHDTKYATITSILAPIYALTTWWQMNSSVSMSYAHYLGRDHYDDRVATTDQLGPNIFLFFPFWVAAPLAHANCLRCPSYGSISGVGPPRGELWGSKIDIDFNFNIKLDLLKRFNSSDTLLVGDISEKNALEMKMREICHDRSSSLFEPRVVMVKAPVLQDVINAPKKQKETRWELCSWESKTPMVFIIGSYAWYGSIDTHRRHQ